MHGRAKQPQTGTGRIALGLILGFVTAWTGAACAQTPAVPIPAGNDAPFPPPDTSLQLSNSPFNEPATFDLIPKTADGPHGKIWVRSSKDGLVVWGKVDLAGSSMQWPEQKSDMLASTHVEVWLAASTSVELPEIGFGNQFGESTYKTADDCKEAGNDP